MNIITHPRSYSQGFQLGSHVHTEAQLLYSASGLMNVTTPKGRFLVPPQKAVWIPPKIEHSVDVLADIEMRSIYIQPSWLQKHNNIKQLSEVYVIAVSPLLRELILTAYSKDIACDRLELLITLALYELIESSDATTFLPMPNDPRAKLVADVALKDIACVKSLEQLCYDANASTRTITRLFTEETNLNFREWRQRARIMNAVELLGNNHRSIKQIATALGFSSTAAFAHAFKKVMNVTPSEFVGTRATSVQ